LKRIYLQKEKSGKLNGARTVTHFHPSQENIDLKKKLRNKLFSLGKIGSEGRIKKPLIVFILLKILQI